MQMNYKKILSAVNCLSPPLKKLLEQHMEFIAQNAADIRLRLNRPLTISTRDGVYFPSNDGGILQAIPDKAVIITKTDLLDTYNRICRYSVYSVQNELINGFVTVSGGHRAGICGTAVINSGKIVNIRDISSINLRIAREVKGCAEKLIKKIENTKSGVLICGEPSSGKTTILRDLARNISIKENKNISLIDERGELAAPVCGINQNDVGLCDVFCGYPKHKAVEQALRCMSPEYIICDEIGTDEDLKAVESCVNSGVTVIAALHAKSKNELLGKPNALRLLKTGAFGTVVFLKSRKNAGEISSVETTGDLLVN